jgi:hypothetical protein
MPCGQLKINLTFQRNMSPPSSGSKNKPRKNQHAGNKQSSVYYVFHADFFLGLFFDPEDGGDMSLRNVR